ncbi:MAG: efflux transporter outer membrane subunit [Chlamydiota bacterium]
MRYVYPAFLLCLAGCKIGPNYHKPEIAMPDTFVESKSQEEVLEKDFCTWWEHWNDPLLNSLVKEAVGGNFDLRIALEKIIEARSYYRIESSYLGPAVNLNALATRSRFSQNIFTNRNDVESIGTGAAPGGAGDTGSSSATPKGSGFGPPLQNFFQVGFDAVWELDIWGSLRRTQKASEEEWEAVQMQAQDVLLTTISEVVRTYVTIRSLQQQIDILQKKIGLEKRNLCLTKSLQDAGLDSQRPVEEMIVALEQDLANMPVLETSYKQTVFALAVLLGRQPESLLSTFAEIKPIPTSFGKVPGGLPSDLLRRRPDIRAAERQLAAATERIGVAIADYFPQISLTGNSYGYESNKQNNWIVPGSRYWTIGPNVQWNLLSFGKTRAQVSMADSLQRQALLSYEQVIIESLQDVEGALVAYFEEQKRALHLLNEKEATYRFFRLTDDLFTSGLVDEMQVLQAQSDMLDKENECLQSEQALASDLVALYKALGGDWECSATP